MLKKMAKTAARRVGLATVEKVAKMTTAATTTGQTKTVQTV